MSVYPSLRIAPKTPQLSITQNEMDQKSVSSQETAVSTTADARYQKVDAVCTNVLGEQLNSREDPKEPNLLTDISSDPLKITLLDEAIKSNNITKVKELITKASATVLSKCWFNAIETNSNAIISLFLDNGVDVNYRDMDGSTAMHFAAMKGNLELIGKLGLLGADINVQNKLEQTPLYQALKNNKPHAISALHQLGTDINAILDKEKGLTALMVASHNGWLETVQTLLKLGADKSLRDKEGHSALINASYLMHIPVMTELLGPSATSHLTKYSLTYLPREASLLPLAKACFESESKSRYDPQVLALKLLSHSWRIAARIKIDNTEFNAGTQAFSPIWARIMMGASQEFAKNFRNELSSKEVDLIDIFLSSIDEKVSPQLIRKALEKGDPVLLLPGYSGHAINVFFYAGYLVIPNKGNGSRKPVEVFKIPSDLLAEEAIERFIEFLISVNERGIQSYDILLKFISKFSTTDEVCTQVENGYPVNQLGKYQLLSNCTWESLETAVYGLLALQRTLSAPKDAQKQAVVKARDTFLHWRGFMLFHAIEDYFDFHSLEEMAYIEMNPLLNEIFLASAATDWSVYGKDIEQQAVLSEKRYLEMLPEKSQKAYLNAKRMQQVKQIATKALSIVSILGLTYAFLRT